jgi:hypothetical protein
MTQEPCIMGWLKVTRGTVPIPSRFLPVRHAIRSSELIYAGLGARRLAVECLIMPRAGGRAMQN